MSSEALKALGTVMVEEFEKASQVSFGPGKHFHSIYIESCVEDFS